MRVDTVDGEPVVLDADAGHVELDLDDGVQRDLEVRQLREGGFQQQGQQAPRRNTMG